MSERVSEFMWLRRGGVIFLSVLDLVVTVKYFSSSSRGIRSRNVLCVLYLPYDALAIA